MKRSLAPVSVLVLAAALAAGCSSSDPANPSGGVALPGSSFLIPLAFTSATYAESIEPTDGTPPYTWTVDTAGLPPGIAAVGGDAALDLSGMPTATGQYNFEISVRDAEDTEADATVTCWVTDVVAAAGSWQFSITVTAAEGACDGEEGESSSETIELAQNASIVTANGFLGVPSNQLTGTVTGSRMSISGTYPEDGGMTTATYNLTFFSPDRMEGVETWTWDTDGQPPVECPGGLATVTAVRLAP